VRQRGSQGGGEKIFGDVTPRVKKRSEKRKTGSAISGRGEEMSGSLLETQLPQMRKEAEFICLEHSRSTVRTGRKGKEDKFQI